MLGATFSLIEVGRLLELAEGLLLAQGVCSELGGEWVGLLQEDGGQHPTELEIPRAGIQC